MALTSGQAVFHSKLQFTKGPFRHFSRQEEQVKFSHAGIPVKQIGRNVANRSRQGAVAPLPQALSAFWWQEPHWIGWAGQLRVSSFAAFADSQRVHLDCQYGIRAQKPYRVWYLGPNSIVAMNGPSGIVCQSKCRISPGFWSHCSR